MNVIEFLTVSMMPGFEPRYAVLVALASGWNIFETLLLSFVAVVLLSFVLTQSIWLADRIIKRIPLLNSFWEKYVSAARNRVKEYVNRYGFVGLSLFVAIPLPATGIWTGAVAAYFLGLEKRKTFLAAVIGGVISVLIVVLAYSGVLGLSKFVL